MASPAARLIAPATVQTPHALDVSEPLTTLQKLLSNTVLSLYLGTT